MMLRASVDVHRSSQLLPDLTDAHNASIKLAPSNDSVDNVVADAVQPRRSSRKRKEKNKSSDDD
jgi:hypothetical protein